MSHDLYTQASLLVTRNDGTEILNPNAGAVPLEDGVGLTLYTMAVVLDGKLLRPQFEVLPLSKCLSRMSWEDAVRVFRPGAQVAPGRMAMAFRDLREAATAWPTDIQHFPFDVETVSFGAYGPTAKAPGTKTTALKMVMAGMPLPFQNRDIDSFHPLVVDVDGNPQEYHFNPDYDLGSLGVTEAEMPRASGDLFISQIREGAGLRENGRETSGDVAWIRADKFFQDYRLTPVSSFARRRGDDVYVCRLVRNVGMCINIPDSQWEDSRKTEFSRCFLTMDYRRIWKNAPVIAAKMEAVRPAEAEEPTESEIREDDSVPEDAQDALTFG